MSTTRGHLPNRCLEDAAFALRVAVHEATLFSAHREPSQRLRRAAQTLVSGLRSSSSEPSGSETGAVPATELERRILALARDLQVAVGARTVEPAEAIAVLDILAGLGRQLRARCGDLRSVTDPEHGTAAAPAEVRSLELGSAL